MWSFTHGWGKITSNESADMSDKYPIEVEFDDYTRITFSRDGREAAFENVILFFNSFEAPESAYIQPKQLFKINDVVKIIRKRDKAFDYKVFESYDNGCLSFYTGFELDTSEWYEADYDFELVKEA